MRQVVRWLLIVVSFFGGVCAVDATSLELDSYLLDSVSMLAVQTPQEVEWVLEMDGFLPREKMYLSHDDIILLLQSRERRTPLESEILFRYMVYIGDCEGAWALAAEGVQADIVLGGREKDPLFKSTRGVQIRLVELAAMHSHWRMVELLLACGASAERQSMDKMSLLCWACLQDNRALFERLMKLAPPDVSDKQVLWAAFSSRGYLYYLSRLFECGFAVDWITEEGISLVELAIIYDRADLLEYLARHGADLQYRSTMGEQEIQKAKESGKGNCDELRMLWLEKSRQPM